MPGGWGTDDVTEPFPPCRWGSGNWTCLFSASFGRCMNRSRSTRAFFKTCPRLSTRKAAWLLRTASRMRRKTSRRISQAPRGKRRTPWANASTCYSPRTLGISGFRTLFTSPSELPFCEMPVCLWLYLQKRFGFCFSFLSRVGRGT